MNSGVISTVGDDKLSDSDKSKTTAYKKKKLNVRTKLKFSATKLSLLLEEDLNLDNYINDDYVYYHRRCPNNKENAPNMSENAMSEKSNDYEIDKFIAKEKDGIPLTCSDKFQNLNSKHLCPHRNIIEKHLQLRNVDEETTVRRSCLECNPRIRD